MKEIWKIIKDFPDYQISNYGKVKSLKFDSHGYLVVNLYKNKKPYTKTIHRLVLENFKPIENMDKFECNHKDGNKENNIFPENIEWCSHSENIKHAFKNKLRNNKGEKNPSSILTEEKVIKIRTDLNEGILTQKQIAEKFGVSQVTISDIKTEKRWSHV